MFEFNTVIPYDLCMAGKRKIATFQIDDKLEKKLDDYRFENRINTRSEAIRRLLEEGLKRYKREKAD